MTTQTGTVKWFNDAKGYGFIAQDAGGADLFAHFRDIVGTGFKTLTENQKVEFEVKRGPKGLQAQNVRPCLYAPSGPATGLVSSRGRALFIEATGSGISLSRCLI